MRRRAFWDIKPLEETMDINMTKNLTVPEMLRLAAKLYESRNAQYKDNYKRFGRACVDLIGDITLKTSNDYNRFALFTHIMTKLSRYAVKFHQGGHDDSLDDIVVYAMMLKELDIDHRNNGTFAGGENDEV